MNQPKSIRAARLRKMTTQLHPSVAATDFLLVVTTSLCIKKIGLANRYVLVGFLLMTLAALLGVFRYLPSEIKNLFRRFGISLQFLPFHRFATQLSTQIGFPLTCLGVLFAQSPRKSSVQNFLIDATILGVLFALSNFVWKWKPYEDVIGVASSLCMVYYGLKFSFHDHLIDQEFEIRIKTF